MKNPECPYCSNPDFFADWLKGRAKKIAVPLPFYRRQEKFWKQEVREPKNEIATGVNARGEKLHTFFDGSDFEEGWREFTVEVFGIEYADESLLPLPTDTNLPSPPMPFLRFDLPTPTGVNLPPRYHLFFVCRITHRDSDLSLVAHWWTTHGRLIDVRGSLSTESNDDLGIIKKALDFFQRETRGNPKISEEAIITALKRLGSDPTQQAVADELQVTRQALENWRAKQGLSTWKEVSERFT
jgi:hypothetical protein